MVPQLSGKLTSARIWSDQLMVDHFSDLTYVHIMIITSQEDALAGKSEFDIWAYTCRVKSNRYHTYNGRFSEYLFIPVIDYSNRTRTFCGVGYHHQNSMVERKIQTLTL